MRRAKTTLELVFPDRGNSNPNVNCLEGKRCPDCGSYGPFEVVVSMRVLLCDNGTDNAEDGSIEYGDDASTKCCSCGHTGIFGDFEG
jgi:hypothetical protein